MLGIAGSCGFVCKRRRLPKNFAVNAVCSLATNAHSPENPLRGPPMKYLGFITLNICRQCPSTNLKPQNGHKTQRSEKYLVTKSSQKKKNALLVCKNNVVISMCELEKEVD